MHFICNSKKDESTSETSEGTSDIQQLSTLKTAGLLNIKGKFVVDDAVRSTATGAFYNGANFNYDASSSTGNGGYIEFDASRSNPIYLRRTYQSSDTSNYCFNLY